MRRYRRGAEAAILYVALLGLPLLVGILHDPLQGQRALPGMLVAGVGFLGLAILAFQFGLISRLSWVSAAFGQDALQRFHRTTGFLALGLILLHLTLLHWNGFSLSTLLNPWNDNPGSLKCGTWAFYALLVLIALSVFYKLLRLSYEWWQWTHAFLAMGVVGGGLLHIFGIADYTGTLAMKSLWLFYALVLAGLTLRYRLVLPLLRWKHPWVVVENRPEADHCHTLVLKPVGHPGFSFEPGQFAWLLTGSPFAFEQHPISFSSGGDVAPGGSIDVTVKELGDWSSLVVPTLQPGTRLWVDGPYGAFSADRIQGPGYVLISGGSGVTPFHSMLRTWHERGDVRPVVLFYGCRDWEEVAFKDDFAAMVQQAHVKIVYVLEHPPASWTGESGLLTRELLLRHLPKGFRHYPFFVCGPPAMMEAVEPMLSSLDVPPENIHTERFTLL